MQKTRKLLNSVFLDRWCPNPTCGKVVEAKVVHTGLPGIQSWKCPLCNSQYSANFLESDDDVLTVPDNLVFPEQKETSNA